MGNGITREMLSDGSILLSMKQRFLTEQTQENIMALLLCLRDSTVYVPLIMKMSSRDEEKFKSGKEGDSVEFQDDVHLSPDIFMAEGREMFFPVFSQREQIDKEYAKDFSIMPFDIIKCLEMAHSIEGVCGIVLDPQTQPLPVLFEMADVIEKLPSMIEE